MAIVGKRRWFVLPLALATGCVAGPWQKEAGNPTAKPIIGPENLAHGNPLFLPVGPQSYGLVFEGALDVLDEVFDIAYANRYDGRIESYPRIAPGFFQPWQAGSTSGYERIMATFQSIRHRAVLAINAAEDGGFFVDLKVYKELEDLPTPSRTNGAAAAFRNSSTVDREYEILDPNVYDQNWIPLGRDIEMEQLLLGRLSRRSLQGGTARQPF
ncbi:MAG: hypothetical protein ACKO26_09230 [Planctomycetota bacterium]